jgi:hypothetical protein
MPFIHESYDLAEILVPSNARCRLAFAVDHHGKLLIVMRENISDFLDFLSLLCAHVHESTKLGMKINKTTAFDAIHGCLWSAKRRVDGPASVATARGKLRFYHRTMYTRSNR